MGGRSTLAHCDLPLRNPASTRLAARGPRCPRLAMARRAWTHLSFGEGLEGEEINRMSTTLPVQSAIATGAHWQGANPRKRDDAAAKAGLALGSRPRRLGATQGTGGSW